jgi:hypothetical protein
METPMGAEPEALPVAIPPRLHAIRDDDVIVNVPERRWAVVEPVEKHAVVWRTPTTDG